MEAFQPKAPFPWHNLHSFLKADGFQLLFDEFPTLELFERHDDLAREHGQRRTTFITLATIARSNHRNRGFLFKNTPQAWHAVSALTSAPSSYRVCSTSSSKCRPVAV